MTMLYKEALEIVEKSKKIRRKLGRKATEDELLIEYRRNNLYMDSVKEALSICQKAEMFGNAQFDDKNLQDMDFSSMSLTELVDIYAYCSRNNIDSDIIEKITSQMANRVEDIYNSKYQLKTTDIMAADFVLSTGLVKDSPANYLKSQVEKYDEEEGLNQDEKTLDSLFEALQESTKERTFDEKAYLNIIDKKSMDEVNAYFADIKYYDAVVDDKDNVVCGEDGKPQYAEITDLEKKQSYDDAIKKASLLDTVRDVIKNAKELGLTGNLSKKVRAQAFKEAINSTYKDVVQAKLKTIGLVSVTKENAENIIKTAGSHVKRDMHAVENIADQHMDKDIKILDVSAVCNEVAKSVSEAKVFAERAKLKTSKAAHKGIDWFKRRAYYLGKTAQYLWTHRDEMAEAAWDNRYGAVSKYLASAAVSYAVIHAATVGAPVVLGVIGAYTVHSMIANRIYPVIAQANKMKREAKAKGEKPQSFVQRFKQAWNNLKDNKSYRRSAKCGAIFGALGGVAVGVAHAVAGPVLGPVLGLGVESLIAKGSVLVGASAIQGQNFVDAVAMAKKDPQNEKLQVNAHMHFLGLAASLTTTGLMLSNSAGSLGVLDHTHDSTVNDTVSNTGVVAGNDSVTATPSDTTDVQAENVQVEEVFEPKYSNAASDESLLTRINRWNMGDKDVTADQLEGIQNVLANTDSEQLKGLTPTQLLYLAHRISKNIWPKSEADAFIRGVTDCGEVRWSHEQVIAMIEKADDTFYVENGKLGFYKDGYQDTGCDELIVVKDGDCVKTHIVKGNCGCDEDIIEEHHEETIEEQHEETIEEQHEETIEEQHEETIEEQHEETIEEQHEETIEEQHEETIEEQHEETIEEHPDNHGGERELIGTVGRGNRGHTSRNITGHLRGGIGKVTRVNSY